MERAAKQIEKIKNRIYSKNHPERSQSPLGHIQLIEARLLENGLRF